MKSLILRPSHTLACGKLYDWYTAHQFSWWRKVVRQRCTARLVWQGWWCCGCRLLQLQLDKICKPNAAYYISCTIADRKRWISDQNAWIPLCCNILSSRGKISDEDANLFLDWLLYSYPVSESWGAKSKRQTWYLKASLQKDITKWSKWINLVRYTFLCSPNTIHGHFLLTVLNDVHLLYSR